MEHNEFFNNKDILVTGGCGSIGSEIVRQIARFAPRQLILIDQAETPLHYLELETLEYNHGSVEFILCDIANEARMRRIFETLRHCVSPTKTRRVRG